MVAASHHRSRGCHRPRLWWALALFCLQSFTYAATAPSKEYALKAAFLFNFIQFVDWPDSAFPDPKAPFRIGVLGDDPFGGALEDITHGEEIKGRPLVIVRAQEITALADCQLVFFGKSENRRRALLQQLESHPVLTVGERDGFTRQGGVISFYTEGKKVRFEINPAAARRAGLKISSELLGLGKLTPDDRAKGDD
jgi:hypothetical protein